MDEGFEKGFEEGLAKGLDEGQEKATRENILLVGEARFGPPNEAFEAKLITITDLALLKRMIKQSATATSLQEILDTP